MVDLVSCVKKLTPQRGDLIVVQLAEPVDATAIDSLAKQLRDHLGLARGVIIDHGMSLECVPRAEWEAIAARAPGFSAGPRRPQVVGSNTGFTILV